MKTKNKSRMTKNKNLLLVDYFFARHSDSTFSQKLIYFQRGGNFFVAGFPSSNRDDAWK